MWIRLHAGIVSTPGTTPPTPPSRVQDLTWIFFASFSCRGPRLYKYWRELILTDERRDTEERCCKAAFPSDPVQCCNKQKELLPNDPLFMCCHEDASGEMYFKCQSSAIDVLRQCVTASVGPPPAVSTELCNCMYEEALKRPRSMINDQNGELRVANEILRTCCGKNDSFKQQCCTSTLNRVPGFRGLNGIAVCKPTPKPTPNSTDPCFGLCAKGSVCIVKPWKKFPFCVNYKLFQTLKDGETCCRNYGRSARREDGSRVVCRLGTESKVTCKDDSNNKFCSSDTVIRVRNAKKRNVCRSFKSFRYYGGACKIVLNMNGERVCSYYLARKALL